LSIADLAACTYRADKCVAIVVEARELAGREERPAGELLLRTTRQTAVQTIAVVRDFWERVGFMPRFEVESDANGPL
jgi:hypothetical protein